jgi:hypothetical protein
MRRSVAERFFAKVVQSAGDECWHWTAFCDRRGYGQFSTRDMPSARAHRVSWVIHHGQIPDGMCVLHRCDNPPCVNPAHLFLGTLRDNVHDMMTKGRHVTNGNERKTHCPKGHEYTIENTKSVKGKRYCRECGRADVNARYRRSKQAVSHANQI